MDKISLRKKVSNDLKSMDKMAYEHQSQLIAKRLMETNEWKMAKCIGFTISQFPEVDTWQLIRSGWLDGKSIVVAKCIPSVKQLKFKEITSFDQLEKVYMDLYEPKMATTEVMNNKIDLLVVPGLAFNRQGFRVGFGGGYYDRYLNSFFGKTISLAFSSQIIENLPYEEHDIPVEQIMTDQEIIKCKPL
ncbi:5-formyltetrahydrofolate cyclo-ligase [Bacillus sp. FSL K6-3431]|uniref:5-formyltetrahydrofolate cyclo-ligase n=1 Tax=Bacillus sp. FSL K6-3431 TaxID=2921500 RepID=UPI0030F52C97